MVSTQKKPCPPHQGSGEFVHQKIRAVGSPSWRCPCTYCGHHGNTTTPGDAAQETDCLDTELRIG
jgi:hypothetical protein